MCVYARETVLICVCTYIRTFFVYMCVYVCTVDK